MLGPESCLPFTPHSTSATSSATDPKKGDAADFAAAARSVLEKCWRAGEPCVFDLVEELRERWEAAQEQQGSEAIGSEVRREEERGKDSAEEGFSSDGEAGTSSDFESDIDTPGSTASASTTFPNSTRTSTATTPSSNMPSSLGSAAGKAATAGASGASVVFNALIRTHHVTSRKKVGKVKKAAQHELRYLLIRSGGSPGLMYAEGEEGALRGWVGDVAALRYKDYQLARPPAPMSVARALQVTRTSTSASTSTTASTGQKHGKHDRGETAKKLAAAAEDTPGYEEVDSVANFAEAIERRGVLRWWRVAMGYEAGGDVIG